MTTRCRTDVARRDSSPAPCPITESALPPAAEKPSILDEFGARVRRRRTALGLAQQDLADRTGFHHTYVGHVEHGRRNPELDNLCRLAWALDVDLGELLRGLQALSCSGR